MPATRCEFRGTRIGSIGVALRCRHNGSSTPTGEVETDGGKVYLERGIPDAVTEALRKKGHRMAGSGTSYGGYQGIRIDHDLGKLYGGSEPRKDGMALGY